MSLAEPTDTNALDDLGPRNDQSSPADAALIDGVRKKPKSVVPP